MRGLTVASSSVTHPLLYGSEELCLTHLLLYDCEELCLTPALLYDCEELCRTHPVLYDCEELCLTQSCHSIGPTIPLCAASEQSRSA